ncbi:MAG: hypothetical protein L6V91_06625 [Bacilli bacterium]|nr:MAG: hypothetical protein L6V91_06625 [Bacilli bacterium]
MSSLLHWFKHRLMITFYTRRGGGKPYMSAQWNLYDIDGKSCLLYRTRS